MNRRSWKLILVAGVAVATLAVGASKADACWCGSWGPACYTYSCYTPCYSVGCDPCCGTCGGWYLGWRPGPIRRLLFGRYRWYYGGSSCCYTPCYDVCWDAVAVCEPAGVPAVAPSGAEAAPTPAERPKLDTMEQEPPTTTPGLDIEPPATTPGLDMEPPTTTPGLDLGPPTTTPGLDTEPPATTPDTSGSPMPQTSGLLTIWVPYDAKVTINGLATRSTGTKRQYVSYGLKPGFQYKYEIRVTIVRDGERLVEQRVATLTAGDHQALAFGFNVRPAEALASVR